MGNSSSICKHTLRRAVILASVRTQTPVAAQTRTVILIQLLLFHAVWMYQVNTTQGERRALSLNSRTQATTEPKWHCSLPVLSGKDLPTETKPTHPPAVHAAEGAEGCSRQGSLLSLHQHFSPAESSPRALCTEAAGSAAPRGACGQLSGMAGSPPMLRELRSPTLKTQSSSSCFCSNK